VGVHQRGIAGLGKRLRRVEAGNEHGNFQRQPGAAPNGMLGFSRKAHRVSWQNVLRLENVGFDNFGNNGPPTMLEHRHGAGTEFRGPVSS
jgi:hypothetical protein